MRTSFLFWERFLLAERGALLRYGMASALAIGSLAAAGFLRASDFYGAGSLALATVVVSGIYGGLGPALLDAVVTSIGLEYLSEPELGILDSWDSALRLVLHVAVGVLIADVTASLRMAYVRLRYEYGPTWRSGHGRTS